MVLRQAPFIRVKVTTTQWTETAAALALNNLLYLPTEAVQFMEHLLLYNLCPSGYWPASKFDARKERQ